MVDWDIVKQAVEVAQVNDRAGELLLQQAMGCAPSGGCTGECKPGCCGSAGSPTGSTSGETPVPEPTQEKPVIYGKDGYTDGRDPRDDTAKGHRQDSNGKITGIHVNVHTLPDIRFRCTSVQVMSEEKSMGQTVCYVTVKNRAGVIQCNERVVLATGYNGGLTFDAILDAGNGNVPVEHMLSGGPFNPPNLGPLAVFVADANGKPVSDVVGNLGLPYKRHINVLIEFTERG